MKYFFAFVLICTAMSSGVSFAQEATVSDVEAAIIREDYKKANDLAHRLLQAKLPREEAARAGYYAGLSDLRLGNYAQAYEMFKKVVNDRPSTATYEKAYIGVIDTLYMQGYYENALKEAAALMARHRNSEIMSLIYLKIARSNLKLARWNKAREFLQRIVTEYPDTFESRVAKQLLEEKQYFTVQVGAFLDQARADRLVEELMKRKEYAYMVETTTPDGKHFYRVRVGNLTALKDAQALEGKLSGFGYPTRIYP